MTRPSLQTGKSFIVENTFALASDLFRARATRRTRDSMHALGG